MPKKKEKECCLPDEDIEFISDAECNVSNSYNSKNKRFEIFGKKKRKMIRTKSQRTYTIDEFLQKLFMIKPDLSDEYELLKRMMLNEYQNTKKEYILERVTINDKIYYRDDAFKIYDKDVNLVGYFFAMPSQKETHNSVMPNTISNEYKYYLFSEMKKKIKLIK